MMKTSTPSRPAPPMRAAATSFPYASKDAYNYLLITMGAPIYYADGTEIEQNLCYQDTLNFYDWAFNDWAFQTIVKTTDVKGQAKVALCSSQDIVNAVPEQDVNRLMLKSIDSSALQMIANLPEEPIDAPITKGDYLGDTGNPDGGPYHRYGQPGRR